MGDSKVVKDLKKSVALSIKADGFPNVHAMCMLVTLSYYMTDDSYQDYEKDLFDNGLSIVQKRKFWSFFEGVIALSNQAQKT